MNKAMILNNNIVVCWDEELDTVRRVGDVEDVDLDLFEFSGELFADVTDRDAIREAWMNKLYEND